MKTRSSIARFIASAAVLLPLVYAMIIYPSLPDSIPMHFDLQGTVDGYAAKKTIWFIPLLMAATSAAVYLLLANLHRIDPKRAGKSGDIYEKIGILVIVFFSAVSLIMLHSIYSGSITKIMFPLLGLFFLLLGNYMHSVKPNYYVGIRLPWTLEDETNWRKTHQLASKMMTGGAFLYTIISFIIPVNAAIVCFVIYTLIITVVPSIYSYRLFRRRGQAG
jgi:uncharacterized membrane protein